MPLGDKNKLALLLALAAAPAVGAVQDQTTPAPEMQKLLQDCDSHKFETTIHVTGDGEPYDSNVKVCGKQGQTEADWINTLKDIVNKTAASQEMPQSVKDQVIVAVNAEIARLTKLLPREAPTVATLPPPRTTPKDDLAGDYSTLPPLPPPTVTEPATVEARPAGTGAGAAAGVPIATATVTAAPIAAPQVAMVPVVPAPRLTLRCVAGRDLNFAEPCDPIERGNMLVIEAKEALAAGVSLKFLRRGEPRGELSLPAMRAGQPVMVALPSSVCAGVVRSRIEIRAAGVGSSEAVLGPYDLRC